MKGLLSKWIAATTMVMALSGTANADYMSLDWKAEGDQLAFLDIDSGIEWLKLDQTVGMTFNEVSAELGEGGLFEGWRLPTASEVESIVTSLTGYDTNQYRVNSSYNSAAVQSLYVDFVEQFGWGKKTLTGSSWNVEHNYVSFGLYQNADQEVSMSGVRWFKNPRTSASSDYHSYSYVDHYSTSYSGDYYNAAYSVFLVGDGGATLTTQEDMSLVANNPNAANNVSAPSAVTMLSGLLLLLVGWGNRRKIKR